MEMPKVLIIEDEEILRENITELLSADFEVTGIGDAKSGYEICKISKPDVILLDIMLPGMMNGFAFLQRLNLDKLCEDIPILIVSALAGEEQVSRGLELGATDYIVKPFDYDQLKLKIQNIVRLNSNIRSRTIFDDNNNNNILDLNDEFMIRFNQLIERQVVNEKPISIKEISDQLNISQSTLERVIKRETGETPSKYILKKKLEKADLLIQKNKRIPIKEISNCLGFNSVSYFIKCYKRLYKRTPRSISYIK